MPGFWIASVCLSLFAGLTLWRVSVDWRRTTRLSLTTVALVWILYAAQLGLELLAAIRRYLPLEAGGLAFTVLGILLAVTGATICLLGILRFRSIRRMSGVDNSEFIRGGIYAWSRNPQNVGWSLFLLGIALIARSGAAVLAALWFMALFILYVPMEEAHLESVYGAAYREYKDETRRYLGPPSNRGTR